MNKRKDLRTLIDSFTLTHIHISNQYCIILSWIISHTKKNK